MPLKLIRSDSNRVLWNACADRFLAEAAASPGPGGHRTHLWLTHRNLRDSLLERGYDRGVRGWLAPPISFFSELPDRFRIGRNAIGLLARRRLVTELAAREASRLGIGVSGQSGIIRGHMLDGLFSELLPEGVTAAELQDSLESAAADEFARRRNEWVVAVYRSYLEHLGEERFDPRAIHALLAEVIDGGGLRAAIGDAHRLHVYGVPTLRSRRRLFESLARQGEVEALVYVLREPESSEWDVLAERLQLEVEELPPDTTEMRAELRVQPAPDSLREYRWIAAEVKRRLVEDAVEPHEIAVVARTGRADTRRAYAALRAAGVPCTARQRMPLCDIGALKAVLELFRGAASGWTYRPLRTLLTSPYFDTASRTEGENGDRRQIDLRGIDFAARQRRVTGLKSWADELARVAHAKESGTDRDVQRLGVWPDRLRADADRLRSLAEQLAFLEAPRPEREWVTTTLQIVREGVLGLRNRASRAVSDRWEIVRFDQRGLRQLEALLREWAELMTDDGDDPAGGETVAGNLTAGEWHRLLERLLEAHELALSTPAQKGVQVLEAHDAALTPFRVVFVAHANDGEFPRSSVPRGVLLEEERTVLCRAGLPLEDRQLSLRRERTLWRAVAQGDEVTISYRTTDALGTPLLPSPMVPDHDPATELPRTFEPIGEHPVSGEEQLRAAAVALRRSADEGGDLEVADPEPLSRAVVAAYGERMRGVRDQSGTGVTTPNPWHGALRDPAVLEHLESQYGADHVWSASQLEAYATCPFLFLIERVLRLTAADEAEEETTPLTFGGVAHDILQQFYDELIRAGHVPASLDPIRELYDRIAEDTLRQRELSGDWLGSPILWRYTREAIRTSVRGYLEWELPYLASKGERPVQCELVLIDAEGSAIELSGEDVTGVRHTIRFTGRIDRIDAAGTCDAPAYRILDYKSSTTPPAKGYRDGAVLQAPLYMEALRQIKGTVGERGRYRAIKKPGSPSDGAEIVASKPEYRQALRFAFSIPARIRAGLFEPVVAWSRGWQFYHPGIEVTRTRAKLDEESRFDG